MLRYLYLDESGDPGDPVKGSRYLVIVALHVKDSASLERIIKRMRRHKYRKQLRKAREIKANKTKKEIILHMLKELNGVPEARVFVVVLEKRKVYSEYLKSNKHRLYNYVAGKLAESIVLKEVDLEIRIDRSKGRILQDDFNQYFCRKLESCSGNAHRTVFHSYSESWPGLQFADVLSWSFFQKFEHNDDTYVDALTIPKEISYVF